MRVPLLTFNSLAEIPRRASSLGAGRGDELSILSLRFDALSADSHRPDDGPFNSLAEIRRKGYYLGWLGRFREGDMRGVGEGEEVVFIECCGCGCVMLDA
jgi:hypothetical protein